MGNKLSFQKATKAQSFLRAAFIGPAGQGKTYSALSVAQHLGKRIAVIDTEKGSASKYAHRFQFDVLNLEDGNPNNFIEAINLASNAGYDVLVIDSFSHEWNGKNGILEHVDRLIRENKSVNNFSAWREATPLHRKVIDAILNAPMHVICTMRAKVEYVLDDVVKNGRTIKQPRKIGLGPEQRQDIEYEFDVTGELEDAILRIGKTRCDTLFQRVFDKPGKDLADEILAWLTDGAPESTDFAQAKADAKERERLAELAENERLEKTKFTQAVIPVTQITPVTQPPAPVVTELAKKENIITFINKYLRLDSQHNPDFENCFEHKLKRDDLLAMTVDELSDLGRALRQRVEKLQAQQKVVEPANYQVIN